jgi:putative ABC transport system ATP-binding protein
MNPIDQICFQANALTKVYVTGESEVHGLRGVSVEIPKGEMVVMLGPSGSGKSTFLNVIGGLDQPTSGQVFFQNRDLAKLSNHELTYYRRESVGFVFQSYTHTTSKCAFQSDWGASMTECRPPSELAQRSIGVPQSFPLGGFYSNLCCVGYF